MKILHVVPTYLPAWQYGGPIRSIHALCKALVEQGHDVTVYTTNVNGKEIFEHKSNEIIVIDGVKIRYFSCQKLLKRFYFSMGMAIALHKELSQMSIVHLHSIYLFPTLISGLLSRMHGVPYGISPRGMLIKQLVSKKNSFIKKLYISIFEKQNIEKAQFVHFTSELELSEAKYFNIRLPNQFVIPNGILEDIESKLTNEKFLTNPDIYTPYIIFIGRLNWKKGLDRLIEAMNFIKNINLVILGNDEGGYERVLKKMVKDNNLSKRIYFLGEVKGDDKNKLIDRSMMLVLSSYSENFGNVLLEAMQRGKPVASTKAVGLTKTIVETGSGICLPDDPREAGIAINKILEDKKKLFSMGLNAANTAMTRFSWKNIAGSYIDMYLASINSK